MYIKYILYLSIYLHLEAIVPKVLNALVLNA